MLMELDLASQNGTCEAGKVCVRQEVPLTAASIHPLFLCWPEQAGREYQLALGGIQARLNNL